MSVFLQQSGQGDKSVLLLHGWGLNHAVWQPLLPWLEPHYRVLRADLPGHGKSETIEDFSLQGLSTLFARSVPRPHAVIAWSLSGLIAMHWLIHNAAVALPFDKLVLVASSPRFVQAPDWPHAISAAHLNAFGYDLESDYEQTLYRFLCLQAFGAPAMRQQVRALRDSVLQAGVPQPAALTASLRILQETDLRARLDRLRLPVLLLGGRHDVLVPPPALTEMTRSLPQAKCVIIEHAAHAPFFSHPDVFAQALLDFLAAEMDQRNPP